MTGRPSRRRLTTAPWAELAAAIIDGTPALPGALCRRAPARLFDGDTDETRAAATKVCRRCCELAACHQWLTALPPGRRPRGVIAGRFRR